MLPIEFHCVSHCLVRLLANKIKKGIQAAVWWYAYQQDNEPTTNVFISCQTEKPSFEDKSGYLADGRG